MENCIYVDVFFLHNFVMDFLCLIGACALSGRFCSWKKLMAASFAGAFWNTVVVLTGFWFPGMSVLTAALMCLIGTGRHGKKKTMILFLYLTAFSMEGAVRWTKAEETVFLVPLICMVIGKRKKRAEKEMKVVLSFKGRKKELTGFYDTGNLLLEPLTGKMVHIVCYEDVKELLPKEYQEAAEEYFETEILESTKVTKLQMYEFTFLSYHSIGKENGQLLGIRMDSAEFSYEAGKRTEKRPVIALTKQKLFVRQKGQIIVNGRLEL